MRPLASPAAAMAPTICAMKMKIERIGLTVPIMQRARVTWLSISQYRGKKLLPAGEARSEETERHTAGLKRPPLMRKKIQTLIARLKPNIKAMYISCCRSGTVVSVRALSAVFAS